MDFPRRAGFEAREWLLALAATAACGPWPGWSPSPWALVGVCAGLLALARPRGTGWIPWTAVAVSAALAVAPRAPRADVQELAEALGEHCQAMIETAGGLADDEVLVRLLGAAGEAVDPARPFAMLERTARGQEGRTIFLADDRGQIVAWGGADNSWPAEVRALGDRTWGVAWSSGGADLWLREPLLHQGRLVGSILVADRTPLSGRRIWGMAAAPGRRIGVGQHHPGARVLAVPGRPGLAVPLADLGPAAEKPIWLWTGWLLLAVLALGFAPAASWLVVACAGSSLLAGAAPAATGPGLGVFILVAGAAVGRSARALRPPWSRLVVATALTAGITAAVLAAPAPVFRWLPSHLLQPGWGGLWMVAAAWALAGWSKRAGNGLSLDRRLLAAALLALLGLMTLVARIPVQLERAQAARSRVLLPRGDLETKQLLPAAPEEVRMDDLAPVLAERWRLGEWQRPAQLLVVDASGLEVSRSGDLSAAEPDTRVVRRWRLDRPAGWAVELRVAEEPWAWLRDWQRGPRLGSDREGTPWYAVLTRSGEVAASLHPEVEGIGAVRAGELYHDGGGWTWIGVGDGSRPARVWRRDQWLVVALSPHPEATDWVVRTAIAMLWALLGSLVADPPSINRQQLSTFGGRLRLLVAGGVVVPLVVLTLFLHQRITAREADLVQTRGLEALHAARYTVTHLAGGFTVDDELARWLASGWGGEVILWDGIERVAVSRPDLVATGSLPELPLPATYPQYLLGRDDAMVVKRRGQVVAAGSVELRGRPLLLHLFLFETPQTGSALSAVDWLLTGAFLSALLALVMTTRIQRRLSSSLRELVTLARRLVDGGPAQPLRRPPETDLAEVLDAVSAMNEQVQQRESSLRYQGELLRITLETLEPAVFVLEPDGSRRFANESARLLEDEHGDLLLSQIQGVAAELGDEAAGAKSVQPVPGRDLSWQIAVAHVPLPEGTRGLVTVVEDVTELVRADRARQLNELARIVAHEVKNPLTPVRLWVQELQAARACDSAQIGPLLDEACREIAAQVARLQETANSFSNLVALEQWRAEPVDLAPLVVACPSGREVFERRGVSFEYRVASPPPPPVVGDRHWLRRAIANLVQNSVDALGDGPGMVSLRLSVEGGWVVLEVEDSGGGVPDERLPDLFAPHFSTTSAGSGLGLALVQHVVARCQGRVRAVNGTLGLRVRLEFPGPRAAASPEQEKPPRDELG